MPWNESQLSRTLILQRTGNGLNAKYRLHPYWRITTPDGITYMEPVPSGQVSLPHMGFVFDHVDIIEPPGSGQYGGGDTTLTRDTNENTIRLSGDTGVT